MCGRYSLTTPVEAMAQLFGFAERPNTPARYNIAPTQTIPTIVRTDEGARSLRLVRWGLVPSWAKDIGGAPLINARAETVADKPSFRTSFRSRRCLVPADGYYEWQTTAPGKQPYRIVLESGGLFAFAGLWDVWRDPKGEAIESAAFITLAPNAMLAAIHDRMPAILPPAAFDAWLDPKTELPTLRELLVSYPEEEMRAYPVSPRVGRVANDDPSVIEEVAPAPTPDPKAPKKAKVPSQGSLF